MYSIYVDDIKLTPDDYPYDRHCYSTNETLNCIRKQYKAGVRQFYLDLNHDCGNDFQQDGGNYINILKSLENLQHSGKMTNCDFFVKIHDINPVNVQNMRAILKSPGFHEVVNNPIRIGDNKK